MVALMLPCKPNGIRPGYYLDGKFQGTPGCLVMLGKKKKIPVFPLWFPRKLPGCDTISRSLATLEGGLAWLGS